jgi:hypothetical protein
MVCQHPKPIIFAMPFSRCEKLRGDQPAALHFDPASYNKNNGSALDLFFALWERIQCAHPKKDLNMSPPVDEIAQTLFDAIARLHLGEVTELVEEGAPMHLRDSKGQSVLEAVLSSAQDMDEQGQVATLNPELPHFTLQLAIEQLLLNAGASVMDHRSGSPPLIARVLAQSFEAIKNENSDEESELDRLRAWMTGRDAKQGVEQWAPAVIEAWVAGMRQSEADDEEGNDEGLLFGQEAMSVLIEQGVSPVHLLIVKKGMPGYASVQDQLRPFERQAKASPMSEETQRPRKPRARS